MPVAPPLTPAWQTLSSKTILDIPFVREIDQQTDAQGLTINDVMGFQFTKPLPQVNSLVSTLSGGLDYKIYEQDNYNTNSFIFNEYTKNAAGQTIERTSVDQHRDARDARAFNYLPLEIAFNGNMNNFIGPATLGLGLSANLCIQRLHHPPMAPPSFPAGKISHGITGSTESTGYWLILRPSYSQESSFTPTGSRPFAPMANGPASR